MLRHRRPLAAPSRYLIRLFPRPAVSRRIAARQREIRRRDGEGPLLCGLGEASYEVGAVRVVPENRPLVEHWQYHMVDGLRRVEARLAGHRKPKSITGC